MLQGRCAVTGKPLQPGDTTLDIGGRRYGVKAGVWRSMSQQERHALREELARGAREAAGTNGEAAAPDYAAMSFDDLKAEAKRRGLDLTGRRSSESVSALLRLNDVKTRFADTPEASEGEGNALTLPGSEGTVSDGD